MKSIRLLRCGRALGISLVVHGGAVFALWKASPEWRVVPEPAAEVEVVLDTAVSLEIDHLPPLAEPPFLFPPPFAEPSVVDPAVILPQPNIALAQAAESDDPRPGLRRELLDQQQDADPDFTDPADALAYWMPIRANLYARLKALPPSESFTNVLVRLLGLEDGVLVLEPAADGADALRARVRRYAEEVAREAPPPPASLVGRMASISVRFTAD